MLKWSLEPTSEILCWTAEVAYVDVAVVTRKDGANLRNGSHSLALPEEVPPVVATIVLRSGGRRGRRVAKVRKLGLSKRCNGRYG